MAQSPLENVVSHWSKLYEGFQTSPMEFYFAVEEALQRRQIPGYTTSRKDYTEAGLLSANRTYLRVVRQRLAYDICAAPYGNGFFFSSWLTQKPPSAVWFWLAAIIAAFVFVFYQLSAMLPFWLAMFGAFITAPVAFLITLWAVALAAKAGLSAPEDALMTIPLLGTLYERMFAPATYYKIDTTLMFQSAVHSAVLEVIDGLATTKGLRALSDDERKPVMEKLL